MRALSIYSYVVACLCTGALFFSCLFLAPKTLYLLKIGESVFSLPAHLEFLLMIGIPGITIIGGGFIAALTGLVLSLITPVWRRAGKKSLPVFGITLSSISLLLLAWHWFALWKGNENAVLAHESKAESYRRVLVEFTLLAEAEGRIDAAKQRWRELVDYEPQPITAPEQMRNANLRLRQLLMLLQTTDSETAKRILATSKLFEKVLSQDSRKSALLLEAAERVTDRPFDTVPELHLWISQQSGEEWQPLTLYGVSAPTKEASSTR